MILLLITSLFLLLPNISKPQGGQLDNTFGMGGKVTTNIMNSEDYGYSTVIQPDGKIIIAGYALNGPSSDANFTMARYNADGTLDNTFGAGGKVTTNLIYSIDFGYSQDFGNSAAIQSDGKIIIAGYSYDAVNSGDFAIARYNADGTLDTTFGNGGKVTTNFTGDSYDAGSSAAVQLNGKIIVAGYSNNGINNDFAMVRYNSDGSLDNTFGSGGKVTTDFGNVNDFGSFTTIQADGKIILTGQSFNGSNNDFAIARYNSDGSLDNTFGTGGKVITDLGNFNDYASSAIIQQDGKIIVAGTSNNGINSDFAMVRYNEDGTLDNAFGSGGKIKTDIENSNDFGNTAAIQSDEKIILAGYSYTGINDDADFTVIRYNTNGILDNTFGAGGKVTTDFENRYDYGYSTAIQSDGKIIVGGYYDTSFLPDFAVVRYNNNGTLDNSFGINGKSTADLGNSFDAGNSTAIQPDGKIIVAGSSNNGTSPSIAIARYNFDGALDTAFGIEGKVITNLGSSSSGNSTAIQSDNKIIVAGTYDNGSNNDFIVNRYNADGTLDNTFGAAGSAITDLNNLADYGNSAVIQSDQKIILAGTSSGTGGNDFAIVRYNSDGSLDNTFGINGKVITDFGNSDDHGNSAAVQSDGKIIVVGFSSNGINFDFAIARYNPDGILDNSFGNEGKIKTDIQNSEDYSNSVVIQPDGKIIVAGYSSIMGSGYVLTTVRYNINGTTDNTFGTGGKVITNLGTSYGYGNSAAIQTDGKIVVVWNSVNADSNGDFVIVRYNPDGSLDNTFGSDGKALIDFGNSEDNGSSVAIQSDGKIIAAGSSHNGLSSDFAVIRYNAIYPVINFSEILLEFGNIKIDSSAAKTFYIKNTGQASLTVDSIINPAPSGIFTADQTNFIVAEGDSQEVTVTFTPSAAVSYNSILNIYNNASANPDTISLSGSGTSGEAAIISISAASLDFGLVTVNDNLQKKLYIKNIGTADLQVTNITSSENVFTINPKIFSLTPEDSQEVTITFMPADTLLYNGMLSITHNASGSPGIVNLTGRGTANLVAIISLSETAMNFGSVTINNSFQKKLFIKNVGTDSLIITNIISDPPSSGIFSAAPTNFTVAQKDSQEVTVTFTPTDTIPYNGTLTITHNSAGSPSIVNLMGSGTADLLARIEISPSLLDFGYVKRNNNLSKKINIENTGTADLKIDSIKSNNNIFGISPLSLQIKPDSSKDVTITFTPSDSIIYNDTLKIYHNAPGGLQKITLTGSGFIYNAEITVAINKSFGDGNVSSTNNYRIVGLPGIGPIPININGEYEYDWRVYWDNGNDQNYLQENSSYTFTPGKAYWILSKNPLNINQLINNVQLNADNSYSIPLHAGWNLISTPFDRSTTWQNVKSINGLTAANNVLYSWNGSWSNPAVMAAYEGYYFNNTNSLTSLKIPYEPNGSLGKKLSDKGFGINNEKFLSITIKEKNKSEKSEVFLGIDPASKDGYDDKDYYAAPGDFQKTSISLLINEFSKRNRYFFIEQRPEIGEGQEYHIEIKAAANNPIQLDVSGVENFDKYNIYLLDERLQNLYNIKEKKVIELKLVHQYNPFKLYIGTDEYINEVKQKIQPVGYELFQNYPNPFNPNTIIRFSLQGTENITLKIYNILGEAITTLLDNVLYEAGNYEIGFNGRELSSGIYIVRMDAGKFSMQKKMILIK